MGKIIAINISKNKGTVKKEVPEVKFVENYGIEGDAHAGKWHRQISLLSFEHFDHFRDQVQIPFEYGIFGENLLVSQIDFNKVAIGNRILIGKEIILEVTQIGKTCHKSCEIRNIVGECIMPQKGIFAKVIHGGWAKKGDSVCFE